MTAANPSVNFEYSVEEAVAFQLEYLRTTKEGSSWRNREQWKFAVSFVFIVAFLLIWASSDRSIPVVSGLVAFAVIVGAFLTVLFGRYYDHLVRSRLRRLMVEQLGGSGPYTCAIETRPEGLWVAQPTVELTFPWRDAKKIEDSAVGITVTFAGGRVLARARGFTSQDHDDFLASVQKHAPAAAGGATAA